MSRNSMKNSEDVFELKTEYDFSKGIRGRFYEPKKVSLSMRLNNDIILYFRKMAGEKKTGYQTLINMALREYINNIHHE